MMKNVLHYVQNSVVRSIPSGLSDQKQSFLK